MTFTSPKPRYGILCTNPHTGLQFLRVGMGYEADKVHAFGVNNYFIFYYRAEAVQSLQETEPRNRRLWKMKVVKLEETYTIIPTKA